MSSRSETAEANAAHREYLAETQQLVDEQTEALFRMVSAAAEQSGSAAPAIRVARDERTFTAAAGERSAIFRVEAITDLPEGSDRANEFTTSQARCIVQAPDGTSSEWVLHRLGAGDAPRYGWLEAGTEKSIDQAAVSTILRSFFA